MLEKVCESNLELQVHEGAHPLRLPTYRRRTEFANRDEIKIGRVGHSEPEPQQTNRYLIIKSERSVFNRNLLKKSELVSQSIHLVLT